MLWILLSGSDVSRRVDTKLEDKRVGSECVGLAIGVDRSYGVYD